ncbi:MAG: capsule assembly Wzi family protein [Muribaculaceae bacterium]|nr:capsule assembly Wzi family protein [Muribaculaceae bacterium]
MFSILHKIHLNAPPLLSLVASMLATLLLIPLTATAHFPDSLRYETEIYATSSSGKNTPFWLLSNRQGLGSPKRNFGYARAALFKDIDKSKRFSWGAGVDLVAAWRYSAPFHIHQLYGEIKYRAFEVMAGSKEMWCTHNDPKLSSGSLLFSGNALPIPQVRVGIFDYAPFWGTKGRLGVKGYIAYGMFSDSKWQESWAATGSKYTQNVLFHSKGLWLRFANPATSPVTGDVGIEMATQFGGVAYKDGKVVRMKHGFKEWWRAFFPSYRTHNSLNGVATSIEGNMVGQYTIGLQVHPKNADWNIRGYFEHFFEDQSMMTFEYGWKDGLWGIEGILPKNRFVSKIVYEFLYSKDQAGAVNHDKTPEVPEQVSGRDDYYNHSFYPGWQHWGLGIGNPLMISPIYNADNTIRFSSTRIIGHHFGVAGQPSNEIDYRILFSHTKNWGTYDHPLPKVMTNINGLFELNWHLKKLKGWYWGIGFAFDGGNLLGNNFGFGITIGKTGLLKF